jgi:Reverse transcriptase (RNA-dependent DNA polymerase)
LSLWANTATHATCHDIDNSNVLNNLRSLQQFHTSQAVDTNTSSLKLALKSQNSDLWEADIHEKLESLPEAQTWEKVEAPKGAKVFPSKFVLKVKSHSDGAVERHKARLVLLGNLKRPHIDLYNTYAAVAYFTVVRIMFVIACDQKMAYPPIGYEMHFSKRPH